jgi:hypothetical protein
MKRFFSVTSLVLVASLAAMAQDYPKAEVFGGYSFFRADGSSSIRVGGGDNLNGWNASVCGNLNGWFGLAADFSGHYDSSSSTTELSPPGVPGLPPLPTFSTKVNSDTNIFTFLVGPRFSYRKNERMTPFAHVLLGASRRHADSEISSSSFGRVSFSANDTAFAAAVGGGLDVPLSKDLALRVVQAECVLTRSFGNNGNNARVSTGSFFGLVTNSGTTHGRGPRGRLSVKKSRWLAAKGAHCRDYP